MTTTPTPAPRPTPAPTSSPPAGGADIRAALAPGPRPPQPTTLATTLAFGWRALLKLRHVPEQVIEAVALPVVFTVMFTYLFGGALATSTGDYLAFILPGTLVMAVLLVTMYVGTGLHTDMAKGVYDRFRSLPIWQPTPIAGALLGEAARYLLASAVVVGLGLAMGFRPDGGAVGVLAAVALVVAFGLSLAWVWIVLGLVVRTPNTIMSMATVVLFPLTLASNVFVQPDTMPGWLEAFVEVNPVSHLVTAERDLLDGTATAGQVGWVLAAAAALTAAFAPLALRLYRAKQ
jgi:ABC-2 type transport system permease protein